MTIINPQGFSQGFFLFFSCFLLLKRSLSLFDFLVSCVSSDTSASGDTKSRVTDSSQSPSYRIRTGSEQVSLYSPEQSSLHESEGLLLPSVLSSAVPFSHPTYSYYLFFFLVLLCSTDRNVQLVTTSFLPF